MPGTLPFRDVKPHSSQCFEDLIEQLSVKRQRDREDPEEDEYGESGRMDDIDATEDTSPPVIGKLRLMKSGRVVMRIQLPGSKDYLDLELNKGIQPNFFQELVAVDSKSQSMHILAPV